MRRSTGVMIGTIIGCIAGSIAGNVIGNICVNQIEQKRAQKNGTDKEPTENAGPEEAAAVEPREEVQQEQVQVEPTDQLKHAENTEEIPPQNQQPNNQA